MTGIVTGIVYYDQKAVHLVGGLQFTTFSLVHTIFVNFVFISFAALQIVDGLSRTQLSRIHVTCCRRPFGICHACCDASVVVVMLLPTDRDWCRVLRSDGCSLVGYLLFGLVSSSTSSVQIVRSWRRFRFLCCFAYR